MSIKTVNLHIDELVISGLGNCDHRALGDAVQMELKRLLTDNPSPNSFKESSSIKKIVTKPIVSTKSIGAKRLGVQLANSIYRGVSR